MSTAAGHATSSTTAGGDVLNLCANNYLGLADDPRGRRGGARGARPLGLRHGVGALHLRDADDPPRARAAARARSSAPRTRSCSASCFDANGGVFEALLDERDAVISDALNHASIIDGVRLCKAQRLRYANRDMAELEQRLRRGGRTRATGWSSPTACSRWTATSRRSTPICALADRYDALVMVDDSHAVGFVGPTGRGTPELFGVADRVDIVTGTLGKALGGASGGYVAARREIVDAAQAARPPVPVLQLGRAADRRGVAGRARPARGLRRPARAGSTPTPRGSGPAWRRRASTCCPASTRSCPVMFGDARRGRPGGRGAVRARRLRRRLLVPGRAEGAGAHPGAAVGGAHRRRRRHRRRGVRGRPRVPGLTPCCRVPDGTRSALGLDGFAPRVNLAG